MIIFRNIEAGYDKWAPNYDGSNIFSLIENEVPLNYLKPVKDKKILDAGCGTGRYALKLSKLGAKSHGSDISSEMLKVAKKRAQEMKVDVSFKKSSIEDLPWKRNFFDKTICSGVLSHLPKLTKSFEELSRVTKSGGEIVISSYHPFLLRIKSSTCFFQDEKFYKIKRYKHDFEDYFSVIRNLNMTIKDLKELEMPEISKRNLERHGLNSQNFIKKPTVVNLLEEFSEKLIDTFSSFNEFTRTSWELEKTPKILLLNLKNAS